MVPIWPIHNEATKAICGIFCRRIIIIVIYRSCQTILIQTKTRKAWSSDSWVDQPIRRPEELSGTPGIREWVILDHSIPLVYVNLSVALTWWLRFHYICFLADFHSVQRCIIGVVWFVEVWWHLPEPVALREKLMVHNGKKPSIVALTCKWRRIV